MEELMTPSGKMMRQEMFCSENSMTCTQISFKYGNQRESRQCRRMTSLFPLRSSGLILNSLPFKLLISHEDRKRWKGKMEELTLLSEMLEAKKKKKNCSLWEKYQHHYHLVTVFYFKLSLNLNRWMPNTFATEN